MNGYDRQRYERMLRRRPRPIAPSVIYPNGTHSRIVRDEDGFYRIDDAFGLELEFYSLEEILSLADNDLFPEFEGITIGLRKNPNWRRDALYEGLRAWERSGS